MRWKCLGQASLLAGLALVANLWSFSLASTWAAGPPSDSGDGPDLPAAALHFTFVATVTASDGGLHDEFATFLALDGDTAVEGAFSAYTSSHTAIGAAYFFYRDQGGSDDWGQVRTLSYPNGGIDAFGFSVAIDEDTIAVGARARNDNGSAFVFHQGDGGVTTYAQVMAPYATGWDRFGVDVPLAAGAMAVAGPCCEEVRVTGNGARGAPGRGLTRTTRGGHYAGPSARPTRRMTRWERRGDHALAAIEHLILVGRREPGRGPHAADYCRLGAR